MAEPTYDPWGVVLLVMKELSQSGVKSRFEGEQMADAKTAAENLLTAFGVAPAVPLD
ncbi:hypothetical protein [Streptosporangium subroseum]|uniref:hypothetical protein n=1 Tax=Streptosporangium subroseum TaxID=106412 RepID=UPI00308D5A06|nr:hypothetical protein OHB15_47780 [Streptosporangium subroseum]